MIDCVDEIREQLDLVHNLIQAGDSQPVLFGQKLTYRSAEGFAWRFRPADSQPVTVTYRMIPGHWNGCEDTGINICEGLLRGGIHLEQMANHVAKFWSHIIPKGPPEPPPADPWLRQLDAYRPG